MSTLESNPGLGQRGLTLMEVIVTFGIIGVLSAVLFGALVTPRARARKVKCGAVLNQIYFTTTLYAYDNGGRMPASGWFFNRNSTDPRCPGATERLSRVDYGGYTWSPFVFDPAEIVERIAADQWMVDDKIPWHDPKRTRQADGFWYGRVNSLRGDGAVEWVRLSTPP